MIGELLYSTVYGYFVINDLQDKQLAQKSNVVSYRLPSYGIFSTHLQTSYYFGTPRNVEAKGLVIDVDRMAIQATAKDNNPQQRVSYIVAAGMRGSAMEHAVPEKVFSTKDNPAKGISAVKAISLAAQAGQNVWRISQDNLNSALSAINLDSDIETEIRNAVNAGKLAYTHEAPVKFGISHATFFE